MYMHIYICTDVKMYVYIYIYIFVHVYIERAGSWKIAFRDAIQHAAPASLEATH